LLRWLIFARDRSGKLYLVVDRPKHVGMCASRTWNVPIAIGKPDPEERGGRIEWI
jgi:hypothetical protein